MTWTKFRSRAGRLTLYIIARLNDRGTWTAGVPALLALIGVKIDPAASEAITTLGLFAAAALSATIPDGKIINFGDEDG